MIGRTEVKLNYLVSIPSLMDISFGIFVDTVNEPSHFLHASRKFLFYYLVGCGISFSLLVVVCMLWLFLIRFSVTMSFISARAIYRSLNLYASFS